jgi:hypothetical protein
VIKIAPLSMTSSIDMFIVPAMNPRTPNTTKPAKIPVKKLVNVTIKASLKKKHTRARVFTQLGVAAQVYKNTNSVCKMQGSKAI